MESEPAATASGLGEPSKVLSGAIGSRGKDGGEDDMTAVILWDPPTNSTATEVYWERQDSLVVWNVTHAALQHRSVDPTTTDTFHVRHLIMPVITWLPHEKLTNSTLYNHW